MGKIIRNGIEFSGACEDATAINYNNSLSGLEAQTVQEAVDELNESLGGLRFGVDGEGNYGYFGADDSLIPFSSGKYGTVTLGNGGSFEIDWNTSSFSMLMISARRSDIVYGTYIATPNSATITENTGAFTSSSVVIENGKISGMLGSTTYNGKTATYIIVKTNL